MRTNHARRPPLFSRSAAPLRQVVTLSRLAPDTAPLPPRRLELFINALSQEDGPPEGGADTAFYTSELCRQVRPRGGGRGSVEVASKGLQLSGARGEGEQRLGQSS